jgi:DNA-binding response OmpR family regulator
VRLLIADDDAASRRRLEYIFTKEGYQVLLVANGASALLSMQNDNTPWLAILDIMMPGMSGIEICQRIRSINYSIPPYIIILTVKGSRQDIIRGLEAGADDYLTKPFDTEELKSRVRVGVRMLDLHLKLFNRVKDLEETLSRVQQLQGLLRRASHIYEFGPFRLEAAQRRLLHNGEPLQITSKGLDLLLLLVQNSGYLIEKEEIMREIWPNMIVEENNLTVHISTLRKLLGDDHGQHNYIKTVPTRGYRFIARVIEVHE